MQKLYRAIDAGESARYAPAMTCPPSRGGPVVCIALTPALQRTLWFAALHPGSVNRASRQQWSPGGKAVNCARTLGHLGREAILLGFNGGHTGQTLCESLDALGIRHDFTGISASTRICTTLLDETQHQLTELVEEAPWPSPEEVGPLYTTLERHLPDAAAVILAGVLPPAGDPETYAVLAGLARKHQVPLFVDTCREPYHAALREAPLFMKMNRDELAMTTRLDETEFAREARAAGSEWLLITDGPGDAVLHGPDGERTIFHPPRLDEVSAVGSGDAATAGTVHAWLEGRGMPEAVAFGLACGAANALTESPGEIDPVVVVRMHEQVGRRS